MAPLMTECNECGYTDVRIEGSPCPRPECEGVMLIPEDE